MDIIDFYEFFDDKYRNINNLGIGAVSVITENQLVTRINEPGINTENNELVEGVGRHIKTFSKILADIFDLPEGLNEDFESHYRAINNMTDEEKKVIKEVVEIDYSNSSGGNIMMIKIPKKGIRSGQLEEIDKLLNYLKEVSNNLTEPIKVWCGDENKSIAVEDFNINEITSFLENYVDDEYTQTIHDKHIIGSQVGNLVTIH